MKIKEFIIKDETSLGAKIKKTIKEKGFWSFIVIAWNVLYRFIYKFFREYIPLRWLILNSVDGKIQKDIFGSQMILDLNDRGISRELALYGYHEKNSTKFVKTIICPGMNILEVGANIGYYLMIEGKMAGPDAKIYAFEPSPYNIDCLKKNLTLNNYTNVSIYPYAAGETEFETNFYISRRSNLSSFAPMKDNSQIVKVKVVKLDNFLADKRVDFIRMDIEGYEREALLGLKETLRSEKAPKYFFIEIHSLALNKKGSSTKEFVEYMSGFGYEVKKSFYRGKKSVNSTRELLDHPLREAGYWETFFEKK